MTRGHSDSPYALRLTPYALRLSPFAWAQKQGSFLTQRATLLANVGVLRH